MVEAYEAPGAIALAEIFDYDYLQALLEQTARLRRDPTQVKAEIDKIEHQEWCEKNRDAVFVLTDEDGQQEAFSIEEFL